MEDYKKLWSAVGSAGAVDPADAGKVVMSGSIVQLGPGGPGGIGGAAETARARAARLPTHEIKAVIRYSIVPVEGILYGPPPEPEYPLFIRLRLRPGEGRVIALLKVVDILTGTETVGTSWDSKVLEDTPPPDVWLVTKSGDEVPMSGPVDFVNKAYYVELTLSAQVTNVAEPLRFPPAVSVIELFNTTAKDAYNL